MNTQERILQSLRPRRDGVVFRFELGALGSSTQVSEALKKLVEKGLIEKLDRGIYAKPGTVAQVGRQTLLAHARARRDRDRTQKRIRPQRLTPTARHVLALVKREGVAFTPTFADRWASAVTQLSGDDAKSDATDDLLVALTRSGKLSPSDMVKLVMAHHRDQKLV